jgi:hypothetical protein
VVRKSLNPVWDAAFDFELDAQSMPDQVSLMFWDKDRWGRDDYLGTVYIPLQPASLWADSVPKHFDDQDNQASLSLYNYSLAAKPFFFFFFFLVDCYRFSDIHALLYARLSISFVPPPPCPFLFSLFLSLAPFSNNSHLMHVPKIKNTNKKGQVMSGHALHKEREK